MVHIVETIGKIYDQKESVVVDVVGTPTAMIRGR